MKLSQLKTRRRNLPWDNPQIAKRNVVTRRMQKHAMNFHNCCHLYRKAHNGHPQHTPLWSPVTWHIEKPTHGATYMTQSATHTWSGELSWMVASHKDGMHGSCPRRAQRMIFEEKTPVCTTNEDPSRMCCGAIISFFRCNMAICAHSAEIRLQYRCKQKRGVVAPPPCCLIRFSGLFLSVLPKTQVDRRPRMFNQCCVWEIGTKDFYDLGRDW